MGNEISKAYAFLKECGVYYLTTVSNNMPAARPFGAIMAYEGALYFSTSNNKEVYEQLLENPAIQIVGLKPGTREWIRLNGRAIEVKEVALKQAMLEMCPVLRKHFDSPECATFALFKVNDSRAYFYNEHEKEEEK